MASELSHFNIMRFLRIVVQAMMTIRVGIEVVVESKIIVFVINLAASIELVVRLTLVLHDSIGSLRIWPGTRWSVASMSLASGGACSFTGLDSQASSLSYLLWTPIVVVYPKIITLGKLVEGSLFFLRKGVSASQWGENRPDGLANCEISVIQHELVPDAWALQGWSVLSEGIPNRHCRLLEVPQEREKDEGLAVNEEN